MLRKFHVISADKKLTHDLMELAGHSIAFLKLQKVSQREPLARRKEAIRTSCLVKHAIHANMIHTWLRELNRTWSWRKVTRQAANRCKVASHRELFARCRIMTCSNFWGFVGLMCVCVCVCVSPSVPKRPALPFT